MKRSSAWLVSLLALGCAEGPMHAEDLGRERFAEASVSTSPFNRVSCSTCHAVDGSGRNGLDSGYDLAGVVEREHFWGGYETSLLDALNVCVESFMGGRALAPDDDDARELYAYLASTNAASSDPLPFTLVRDVTSLSELAGDPERGERAYDAACRRCHGAGFTGADRAVTRASILPGDTREVFPDNARAVVVEKIRHGKFFNIGGTMPLYSREALSDEAVADILAYLSL